MTESNQISSDKKQTSAATNSTVPVRVRRSTSRSIKSIVNKVNKKHLGRKATAEDVISKAISLLKETHLDQIIESTYSSEDRLEIQYRKYCKENGYTSKDRFLELLLQANLSRLSKSDS